MNNKEGGNCERKESESDKIDISRSFLSLSCCPVHDDDDDDDEKNLKRDCDCEDMFCRWAVDDDSGDKGDKNE